jgi:hypothetical protein
MSMLAAASFYPGSFGGVWWCDDVRAPMPNSAEDLLNVASKRNLPVPSLSKDVWVEEGNLSRKSEHGK